MSTNDTAAKHRQAAEQWFAKAREDLRVAKAALALADPAFGTASYLCQQAAEKTLKGLLVSRARPFRKTHDLDELVVATQPLFPDLRDLLEPCRVLAPWVSALRYPDVPTDPLPPTLAEVRHAVALIGRLLAAAKQALD